MPLRLQPQTPLTHRSGKGHSNGIVAIAVAGDNVVSVAIDDTARVTPAGEGSRRGKGVVRRGAGG